ncbi:hypothetical protein CBR_g9165 [Chara braunii]|uniref:DUF4360 domain-containing protein n=1 Tax=Chara braunii TaxID=69332 RepID=A0A388KNZ7_CHABU|nr:hypothetical protein CBR_g9165 [Chara braunii]|eukprot:GBG71757.1 hypothetical protein CBR_g9165 [Chara braunii]
MQSDARCGSPLPPLAALAGVLLLILLQLAAHGYAVSPPPGSVKIVGSTYNGDGCPNGSTVIVVSEDAQALTVMFSNFTASTDPPISNQRKQCTVGVKLSYPQGFTFSLGDIILRGYAKLDAGVKGVARTTYYIAGLTGTGKATGPLEGPMDDNFEVPSNFVSPAISQCNTTRDLNINSEVRVVPGRFVPKRSGLITVDSTDLKLTQIFSFSWQAC